LTDVKVKPVRTDAGNLVGYGFYCPGCDHGHVFYTSGTLTWEFNGDLDKPTFKPSLLNTCEPHPDPKQRRCHLVLTDGIIHYCGDCTHDLKGQSVPLEHHWEDP
jgi:hypothetical protein